MVPEESLDNRTVKRSFYWNAVEVYGSQLLQFILGIILARLLMPADYGIMGMITIFICISTSMVSAGFPTALLREKKCSQTDYSTVFFYNIIVGIVLFVGLYLFAPLISEFYNTPDLKSVTRWMGLTFVFVSISGVSNTILMKSLRFKDLSALTLITSILSGIVGIVLAYNGYGVWALVYSNIVSAFCRMIFVVLFAKWMPSLVFSQESFKRLFGFGSKVFGSNLLTHLYSNIYNILIGKYYSASALAYFTRAVGYSVLIPNNISGVIQKALLPLLVKIQDSDDELIKFYAKMTLLTSFIIFPCSFYLAGVAYPIIDVMITSKWLPAAPLLVILCIGIIPEHMFYINNDFIVAKGFSGRLMKEQIWSKGISTVLIIASLPFGLTVAAVAKGVSALISWVISVVYLRSIIDINAKHILKKLAVMLLASVIIFIANFYSFRYLNATLLNIIISFLISVLFYILYSKCFLPELVSQIINFRK